MTIPITITNNATDESTVVSVTCETDEGVPVEMVEAVELNGGEIVEMDLHDGEQLVIRKLSR